jgi:hypothetical protein
MKTLLFAAAFLCLVSGAAFAACPNGGSIESYIYGCPAAASPFASSLFIPAVPGPATPPNSTMEYIPANVLATLSDPQAFTNHTWDCTLNTCLHFPGTALTLTDGTNTVSNVGQITVTGGTVGGATPNATLTISGSGVTWPAANDLVVSNTTNTPAGLVPINGDCVIGSGGVWTAGSCAGGSIGGSGTTNTLPQFTGSTTLGNSPLSVSGGSLISTDPLSLPVGSVSATALNFGTPGTGLFQVGAAIETAIGGALMQSISSTNRTLYGTGAELLDVIERTDTPTTGAVMSAIPFDAANSAAVNTIFGSIGLIPQATTAGAEVGDLGFSASIAGTNTPIATASGVLSAWNIAPGIGLDMNGTQIVTSGRAATFTAMTDSGISGSTQCVHANSAGVFSGTGSDCGSAGGGITQLTGAVLAGPGSGSQAATIPAQALANGMTATTQSPGDNTTDLATDAFVLANGGSPTITTTQHGSANLTLATTDRYVITCNFNNAGCSTGTWATGIAATWTFPTSGSFSTDQAMVIADGAQVVNNTQTLTLAAGAGDTVNNGSNTSINFAGGAFRCQLTRATKNWTCYPSLPNGASAQILVGQGSTVPFAPVSITGDASISPLGVWANNKVNGVAFPSNPGANQVCVTTGGSACTYGTADAALSSNIPLKNGTNTYTGTNYFNGGLSNAIREGPHGTAVTVSSTTDGTIVLTGGSGSTAVGYTCPATPFVFEITDGDGTDVTNPISITPTAGLLNGKSGITLNTSGATVPTYDRIAIHCNPATGNSWVE